MKPTYSAIPQGTADVERTNIPLVASPYPPSNEFNAAETTTTAQDFYNEDNEEEWDGAEWTAIPMTFEKPQHAPTGLSRRLTFHLERAKATYWPLAVKWGHMNKKTLSYAMFLMCLAIGLLILQSTLSSNASREANDWDSTTDSTAVPVMDSGNIDKNFPPSYEDEVEEETPTDYTVGEGASEKNDSTPDESDIDQEGRKENTENLSEEDMEDKHGAEFKEANDEQEAAPNSPWDSVRLPPWQVPTHYDINIRTDLDSFAFEGKVLVDFQLTKSSDFLVIHAANLTISKMTLMLDHEQLTGKAKENPHRQYWTIKFQYPLEQGNYSLSMDFNGTLTDSLRGYYRARLHSDDEESPKYIATTQFEPTDARRAFPCFDEPGLKATFGISMTVPSGYHALSNMPIKETSDAPQEGWKSFVFEKTIRMSTYLIAFVVSDFESVKGKTKRGIDVAVWTQAGKTELGKYALQCATAILDYYEKAYGVLYPLPKSDLIAIPDFSAGAMENMGLVTFRDSALLYNASASSASDKQWVAEVVAHELAHQWFGDLVTMEWWSDLWLNEGFAEFMEYRGTNAAEPTWFMSEQYVANELSRAMRADQSAFTHAIAVNVTDPEEIAEIFDDISYGKGASILGMLEAWLNNVSGPTYFFDSLKKYIEAHAYSNAETWELWKALSSDVDVGAVMSTWTDQPGFPVAIIDDNSVSQERFYISAGVPDKELESLAAYLPESRKFLNFASQTWTIPFVYSVFKTEDGKLIASEPKTILVKEKGPVKIVESLQPGEFILANYGRSGVYRVQYPLSTYRLFSESLEKNIHILPAVDRAGILADSFALSWSGRIKDISVPFNLTRFLKSESDTVVWWAAFAELSTLRAALVLSPAYGRFQSYYLKLVTKVTTDLGWTETSADKSIWHIRALLRAQAFVKAIELDAGKEVDYALEQFERLKQGHVNSTLSVDMYDAIYQAAAQWGTEEDYEWLLMKYKTSSFATEKGRLLNAFTSTVRPYLQIRTLDLVLSGDIRKQDIASLIGAVAAYSPFGHLHTWNWLRSNWNSLIKIWNGDDYTRLNGMLQRVVSRFTQPVLVKEAEDLFLLKKDKSFFIPPRSEISIVKGLEIAKQRIWWLETNGDALEAWLVAEGH